MFISWISNLCLIFRYWHCESSIFSRTDFFQITPHYSFLSFVIRHPFHLLQLIISPQYPIHPTRGIHLHSRTKGWLNFRKYPSINVSKKAASDVFRNLPVNNQRWSLTRPSWEFPENVFRATTQWKTCYCLLINTKLHNRRSKQTFLVPKTSCRRLENFFKMSWKSRNCHDLK